MVKVAAEGDGFVIVPSDSAQKVGNKTNLFHCEPSHARHGLSRSPFKFLHVDISTTRRRTDHIYIQCLHQPPDGRLPLQFTRHPSLHRRPSDRISRFHIFLGIFSAGIPRFSFLLKKKKYFETVLHGSLTLFSLSFSWPFDCSFHSGRRKMQFRMPRIICLQVARLRKLQPPLPPVCPDSWQSEQINKSWTL